MNHLPAVRSVPLPADEKRARVLEAALSVFLAYGFNRTTMDDIARAAELSRPALYLLFRNKQDIYRGLARQVLDDVAAKAREALSQDGTLLEKLDRLVLHAFFEALSHIEESPHGSELFDIKNTLAGDLFSEWRDEISLALEAVIAEQVASQNVDLAARNLTPRILVDVFFDSLEGMKVRFNDPRCHLDAARKSARVLVAALRP